MLVIFVAFLYVANTEFGPNRVIIYVILLCTLFVGYILYEIIRKSKIHDHPHRKSRIKFSSFNVLGITVLLLFLFVIGALQLYPSRYTLEPNSQITLTEFDGMNWFLNKKDIHLDQTSLTVNTYRWASMFLTPQERSKRSDILYPGADIPTNLLIPWHFGYDQMQNLGQFYDSDIYMILSERCRLIYQKTWPEMAKIRFQNEDFSRVEEDTSIDKLYSNGGLDIYYVHSTS